MLQLKDWVLWIFYRRSEGGRAARWAEQVFTVCWLQWRWRNCEVFRQVRLIAQERLRQVVSYVEVTRRAFEDEDPTLEDSGMTGQLESL